MQDTLRYVMNVEQRVRARTSSGGMTVQYCICFIVHLHPYTHTHTATKTLTDLNKHFYKGRPFIQQ